MWKELSAYEGKNLHQLNDAGVDNLLDFLEKFFPEYNRSSSITDPYYIWRVYVQKKTLRYVIVDGQQLQKIPGASRARITLFDENGKLIGSDEFSTGWRIDIIGMVKMQDSIIGVPVIVILTRPFTNGRDIARQYYALYNDNTVLVRLENRDGSITRNTYITNNHMVGPTVKERSVEEWEAALHSTDEVETLLALMWIGGIHDDPAKPGDYGPRPCWGESKYVKQVHQLRGLELVQERLSWLMKSSNQWIREAAEIAANSKGIRKRRKGFSLDLLPNKHMERSRASGFHMIQSTLRARPGDVCP